MNKIMEIEIVVDHSGIDLLVLDIELKSIK